VWIDHQVPKKRSPGIQLGCSRGTLSRGVVKEMFNSYCRLLECLADEEKSWQSNWPETARQLLPLPSLSSRPLSTLLRHLCRLRCCTTCLPRRCRAIHTGSCSCRQPDIVLQRTVQPCQPGGASTSEIGSPPNTLVAVVMEKGWEQVVAVLGILQSAPLIFLLTLSSRRTH